MEFGQAYCQDLLKRILYKFILYFYVLYFIFYSFSKFIHISEILKPEKKFKKVGTVLRRQFGPRIQPRGESCPAGPCPRAVTAHCHHAVARPVRLASGLPGDKIFTLMTRELPGRWPGKVKAAGAHRFLLSLMRGGDAAAFGHRW
jgi:hypothetical protein